MKNISVIITAALASGLYGCAAPEAKKEPMLPAYSPAPKWHIDGGIQRQFSGTEPAGELVFCGTGHCPPLSPKTAFTVPAQAVTGNIAASSLENIKDYEFTTVPFAWNSSSLSQKGKTQIKVLMAELKAKGINSVIVTGSADYRKNLEYNRSLAKKRADETMVFIASKAPGMKVEVKSKVVMFGKEKTEKLPNFGRNSEILVKKKNAS